MSRVEPPNVKKGPREEVVAQRGAQRSHLGDSVEVVLGAMSLSQLYIKEAKLYNLLR